MFAWGHQFVFKALISPDCCTDAARTHLLTEGSVHTKTCFHHSDDSDAATVELRLLLSWLINLTDSNEMNDRTYPSIVFSLHT